jgi:ketosteroid isomerase-like protein
MGGDIASVVDGLYAAWSLQDIDATLAYCADDICYNVISANGISGLGAEIAGKSAVRSYLLAMAAVWEFIELIPGPYVIDGNEVREYGTYLCRHRATGEFLETRKRHVWQVENGRITRCTEYQDAFHLDAFLRMARPREEVSTCLAPARWKP